MKIIHRISIASGPGIRQELRAIGIDVLASGLVTFEVDESDPAWTSLARWVERRGAVDIVRTEFSMKEIRSARWLELVPDWHHGYPQPREDVFGYRDATYDLAEYCSECGIGLRQKAPFQRSGEPQWGRKSILQLHWVYDEYFVRPDVWSDIFAAKGVGSRPVTDTKGRELETVVQLVIGEEVGVVVTGLPFTRCARCGRTKYLPVKRGPFPELMSEPAGSMAKTEQYFGSGAMASKGVLVSRELAASLSAGKISGASWKPVAGH